MTALCDGCWHETVTEALVFFQAQGHICRYCATCSEQYKDLKKAADAAGRRMQRLLDLETDDLRSRCSLKLIPSDLPKLMVNPAGEAVTLG